MKDFELIDETVAPTTYGHVVYATKLEGGSIYLTMGDDGCVVITKNQLMQLMNTLNEDLNNDNRN